MPSYRGSFPNSSSPLPLTVLYEDNHLIAVYKPAGLLTQGDRSGDASLLENVKAFLKAKYSKPGAVFVGLLHRLDRPVSGIVLFAKTSKGASRLSGQFRDRSIQKRYLARVEGELKPPRGGLTHFLLAAEDAVRVYSAPFPEAKRCELEYVVREASPDSSLVEIELLTGRKHQIRAQFAKTGHPIIGDAKYGAAEKFSRTEGIALMAKSIAFFHPTEPSRRISVELPLALYPKSLLGKKN